MGIFISRFGSGQSYSRIRNPGLQAVFLCDIMVARGTWLLNNMVFSILCARLIYTSIFCPFSLLTQKNVRKTFYWCAVLSKQPSSNIGRAALYGLDHSYAARKEE